MPAAGSKKSHLNVTVGGANGKTYLAGEDIPADVVKQIDNPKVWEKPEAGDSETAGN